MSATVTLTRAALVDLLVTAASLGKDMGDRSTRGDVADALATYGLDDGPRLDKAILHAERSTA